MAAKDKIEEAVKVVEDVEAEDAKLEGLIAVFKEDVRLFVHASCVEAHEIIGWFRAKL